MVDNFKIATCNPDVYKQLHQFYRPPRDCSQKYWKGMSFVLKNYFRGNRLSEAERLRRRRYLSKDGRATVVELEEDQKAHDRWCDKLQRKRDLIRRHMKNEKFVPPACDIHFPRGRDGVRRQVKLRRKADKNEGYQELASKLPPPYPNRVQLPPLENKSSVLDVHKVFTKSETQRRKARKLCTCPDPKKEDIYDGLLILPGHLMYMDPFSFDVRKHRNGSADPRVGHQGNKPRPLEPSPPYYKLLQGVPGFEDLADKSMEKLPRYMQVDTRLSGGLALGSKAAAAKLLTVQNLKEDEEFWRHMLQDKYLYYACCNMQNKIELDELRKEIFGDKEDEYYEFGFKRPLNNFAKMGEMGKVEINEVIGTLGDFIVNSDEEDEDEGGDEMDHKAYEYKKWQQQCEEEEKQLKKRLRGIDMFQEPVGIAREDTSSIFEHYDNIKKWLMSSIALDEEYKRKAAERCNTYSRYDSYLSTGAVTTASSTECPPSPADRNYSFRRPFSAILEALEQFEATEEDEGQ